VKEDKHVESKVSELSREKESDSADEKTILAKTESERNNQQAADIQLTKEDVVLVLLSVCSHV